MAYPVDRVSGGVEGQSLSKNVHKNAYEFKSSILSLTTLRSEERRVGKECRL